MDHHNTEEHLDSLRFAYGRFNPHGKLEVWAGGEIHRMAVRGPFNQEGIESMNRMRLEFFEAHPPVNPYVHLTFCHGSMLASPRAMEVFAQGLRETFSRFRPPLATAWVAQGNVEGFAIMAPKFSAALRAVGTHMRTFQDEASAVAWLREVLLGRACSL